MKTPKLEYRTIVQDSKDPGYVNRLLIGTPATGLVRMEWVQARYGQVIPVNWSMVTMTQYLDAYIPMRYQVAEAQNLIVDYFIKGDFVWCLLYEHDVIPQPDALVRLNEYIREQKVPVVSGLYFTRAEPSEPLVFRGRGNGCFTKFKIGEKVWCDGVPTGFLLIHRSLLKVMWDDSPEYEVGKGKTAQTIRRVFQTPRDSWYNPETAQWNMSGGTSDLDWCTRVIKEGYLAKAGWGRLAKKEWPFLCDTALLCQHTDPDGRQFPSHAKSVRLG